MNMPSPVHRPFQWSEKKAVALQHDQSTRAPHKTNAKDKKITTPSSRGNSNMKSSTSFLSSWFHNSNKKSDNTSYLSLDHQQHRHHTSVQLPTSSVPIITTNSAAAAPPPRSQSINIVTSMHGEDDDDEDDDDEDKNYLTARPRSSTSNHTYSSSSPNSSDRSSTIVGSVSPRPSSMQLSSSFTASYSYDYHNSTHAPPLIQHKHRHNSMSERIRKLFVRQPAQQSDDDNNVAVFGGELESLCPDDNNESSSSAAAAPPAVLQQCISSLESLPHPSGDSALCALDCEGIYRISGNAHSIYKLACAIDDEHRLNHKRKSYNCLESCADVHVITGILKLFFRKLSQPLIPSSFYDDFMDAYRESDSNEQHKIAKFRRLVTLIPNCNQETMKVLFRHLIRVNEHCKRNRMTMSNLGVVFGPALMWPSTSTSQLSSCHHSPASSSSTSKSRAVANNNNNMSSCLRSSSFFLTVPVSPAANKNSSSSLPISIPKSEKRSSQQMSSSLSFSYDDDDDVKSRLCTSASSATLPPPLAAAAAPSSSSLVTANMFNKSASICSSSSSSSPSTAAAPAAAATQQRMRSNTLFATTTTTTTPASDMSLLNDIFCQNYIVEFMLVHLDDIFI